MGKSTFLTEEQLWGKKQSKIIKEKGARAKVSPYAILLGAYVNDEGYGLSWSSSEFDAGNVRAMDSDGIKLWATPNKRTVGGRPASLCSKKSEISPNVVKDKGADEIWEIEEYEYPHDPVSNKISKILNAKGSGVVKTDAFITRDTRKYDENDKGFEKEEQPIWEYNGKRYIEVKATLYNEGTVILGKKYNSGDKVWVEIQPQKEWYDPETGERLTQEIVFAGVQMNLSNNYYGDLTDTDMQRNMLNKYDKEKVVKPKPKTSMFGVSGLEVGSFEIMVNDCILNKNDGGFKNGIRVTYPAKNEYNIGEELDSTGMKVEVAYASGTRTIDPSDLALEGFDTTTPGKRLIKIIVPQTPTQK